MNEIKKNDTIYKYEVINVKRRFDIFLDAAQFPLIVMFIASILLGLGNLLTNQQLSTVFGNTENILIISAFLKTCGFYIIQYFPLILLFYILTKKFDDTAAGLIGVVSYFTLLITTMFFVKAKLPNYAYSTSFGLSIDSVNFSFLGSTVRYPLNLGVFATLICYYLVKICFNHTRNRRTYGATAFIDKNTMALILSIIFSVFMGFVISYVWPVFIQALSGVFSFIADDITNPFNLFIYGIVDKLMSIYNLGDIPRSVFWFSEFGGSWLDGFGRKFAGDVAIWTTQISSSSLTSGIGRFITPLYLIQIFAIPGYLCAMFSMYTNRFERRKYVLFLVIACLASAFMGSSLPFDMVMICTTPLLYFIHVFISGVLFAVLQWSKIFIGYKYIGSVGMAAPGSLGDLLIYVNSPTMFQAIQVLFTIGLVVFALYFAITRLYYRYLAIDMFQSGDEKALVNDVVEALGSLDNIRLIDSNPFRILVQVHEETKVDISKLRTLCNSKVFESKTGFVLYFYKASHAIHVEISRMIKANKANSN